MDGGSVMLGFRWVDVITIAALLAGPVLAVLATRFVERLKEARERRVEVFRSLMRTRSAQLDPLHVGSLNLVEIEFYKKESVLRPYREYIKHLSSPLPVPTEQDRFFEARTDRFVELLHAIGSYLGYTLDKRDLTRLAYAPFVWSDDQARMRRNASLLTDILEGTRALPVTILTSPPSNPFPPPPSPDQPAPS